MKYELCYMSEATCTLLVVDSVFPLVDHQTREYVPIAGFLVPTSPIVFSVCAQPWEGPDPRPSVDTSPIM